MYNTIKTLKSRGKSQRKISKELKIHRNTVNRILGAISLGKNNPDPIQKNKILDQYKEDIEYYLSIGYSGKQIYQKLVSKDVNISYQSVARYLNGYKSKGEVYVPLNMPPGEEAQVDFGYFGLFVKNGKSVKVWCFNMVLSHSRYAYYCLVTNQSVSTFINCHIKAFEYFGGVPATVKLDNLRAGVLKVDLYEPIFQHQYSEFLSYYGSSGVTARPRRGQDKGKVESGVKYVKGNFLKVIEHNDFYKLEKELQSWNTSICNKRLHGTTRKIPMDVFNNIERAELLQLPSERYEILHIEYRKVNSLAHINFRYNYYSVPYEFAKEEIRIESNGSLLRVYKGSEQIALHQISDSEGNYITNENHKPPYKQNKSREYYMEMMQNIGNYAVIFMEALEKHRPRHWHHMIRGVIHLQKQHTNEAIDKSCERALLFNAFSYQSVKQICEKKLYELNDNLPVNTEIMGGYNHDLSIYDKLTNSILMNINQ